MFTTPTDAPRFLDLFCGIGGLSLGLQRAGLRPLGGIDAWDDALATFRRNHPGVPALRADVNELDAARIEEGARPAPR